MDAPSTWEQRFREIWSTLKSSGCLATIVRQCPSGLRLATTHSVATATEAESAQMMRDFSNAQVGERLGLLLIWFVTRYAWPENGGEFLDFVRDATDRTRKNSRTVRTNRGKNYRIPLKPLDIARRIASFGEQDEDGDVERFRPLATLACRDLASLTASNEAEALRLDLVATWTACSIWGRLDEEQSSFLEAQLAHVLDVRRGDRYIERFARPLRHFQQALADVLVCLAVAGCANDLTRALRALQQEQKPAAASRTKRRDYRVEGDLCDFGELWRHGPRVGAASSKAGQILVSFLASVGVDECTEPHNALPAVVDLSDSNAVARFASRLEEVETAKRERIGVAIEAFRRVAELVELATLVDRIQPKPDAATITLLGPFVRAVREHLQSGEETSTLADAVSVLGLLRDAVENPAVLDGNDAVSRMLKERVSGLFLEGLRGGRHGLDEFG